MNIKQHLRNICVSVLSIILFDIIYSVLGLLVINNLNIKIVPAVIAIALLCGLLYAGFRIGRKLLSTEKIRIGSIVIIPMILLSVLFGIGILGVPGICYIMQYPAVILLGSLGVMFDEIPILFDIILILYHLMCCLSLLIGSYRKKNKNEV